MPLLVGITMIKHRRERYKSGEKALTDREWEKLMSVVDNVEDDCLFTLAVSTGLRRYDLTNIDIQNILFDSPENPGNWLIFNEKKKGNRIRKIPLNDKSVQSIKKLLNSRGKNYKSTKLFSFKDRAAYNHLQANCKKAGIQTRPFHALRATCIKRCQKAGWTPEQVSSLTGDTIAVIQEHYLTPSTSEMQEVTNSKSVV